MDYVNSPELTNSVKEPELDNSFDKLSKRKLVKDYFLLLFYVFRYLIDILYKKIFFFDKYVFLPFFLKLVRVFLQKLWENGSQVPDFLQV